MSDVPSIVSFSCLAFFLRKPSEVVFHQNSGSRPKEKMTRELDNSAHHKTVMKEMSKIMVKQNPSMTTIPQAVIASRSEEISSRR